jgi:hypothetical protein
VYFAPTKPEGVSDGNWIQTDPKKGWFIVLHLYSPLEPFFTKKWCPSEMRDACATLTHPRRVVSPLARIRDSAWQ